MLKLSVMSSGLLLANRYIFGVPSRISAIPASMSQAVLFSVPASRTFPDTRYLPYHLRKRFSSLYATSTVATMAGKIVSVTSSSHFDKLLSSSIYTIVDFYADWCGPCKTIAPVFANLAEKESKPGKLQFCKVDVDAQQDIARKYGVSA